MRKTLIAACLLCVIASAHAGLKEGVAAFKQRNYSVAVKELTPLAQSGNAEAQYYLGYMYFDGVGVPKDDNQAVMLMRKSADQHFSLGYRGLAWAYENGRGVQKNAPLAIELYDKAIAAGDFTSMSNKGVVLLYGKGVAKDEKAGAKWIKKAAELGNAAGQFTFGALYRDGDGVKQDYKLALHWFHKAAEQGDAEAQYSIGTYGTRRSGYAAGLCHRLGMVSQGGSAG